MGMIFDTEYANESANLYSLDGIQESKYDLGLNGALMHVWENECNYNALMRVVGISELKYYNETGHSLFLNEAGAFKNFIDRAIEFFKKIIEKIKGIFKKFMSVINSYVMKDKEFVKKYEREILRKDITDLEFTGWENMKNGYTGPDDFDITILRNSTDSILYTEDADAINDECETRRGNILKKFTKKDEGKIDESELRDGIKEALYGDKDTFDVDTSMIRTALKTISDTKTTIKKIEGNEKTIIKNINEAIKTLEKSGIDYEKEYKNKDTFGTEEGNKKADIYQKNINALITIDKSTANDLTIAFGMCAQAAKDANRQARALCVKVLGYNKKESAMRESTDDLFSMVEFA